MKKIICLAFLMLAAILVVVICGLKWSLIALLILAGYVLKNLVYAILKI